MVQAFCVLALSVYRIYDAIVSDTYGEYAALMALVDPRCSIEFEYLPEYVPFLRNVRDGKYRACVTDEFRFRTVSSRRWQMGFEPMLREGY